MVENQYVQERDRLLAEIDEEAAQTQAYTGRKQFSARVMNALQKVPRHQFVGADQHDMAYLNRPLSIGQGQTISQPYIVAVMTDLLDITPEDTVLEIGTGCGYQAAVLAEIAKTVYSVETIEVLATAARERLEGLGCKNIHIRTGDGFLGWPEYAPYDAIIVTAAPRTVPPALIEQLKPGGRLVIPIGEAFETQTLYRCVKESDGTLTQKRMLPVAFVPMVKN
ncbi:MAG: protein-L-isoaspartate(D-aspartate) O-methyltransferase [Rhodospirillales bacterium]|jgi:protein-L-isoaspartate(D-aspartate) O-methyltransferase